VAVFFVPNASLRRAKGAKVTSPGHRPGYYAKLGSHALKGRRVPAPFQGVLQPREAETRGGAPGWSASALSAPKDINEDERWKI